MIKNNTFVGIELSNKQFYNLCRALDKHTIEHGFMAEGLETEFYDIFWEPVQTPYGIKDTMVEAFISGYCAALIAGGAA